MFGLIVATWLTVGFGVEAWCLIGAAQTGVLAEMAERGRLAQKKRPMHPVLFSLLCYGAIGVGSLFGMVTWPMTLYRMHLIARGRDD